MKRAGLIIKCLATFATGALVSAWFVGSSFLKPCNHVVNPPPADLPCESVQFQSGSGADIHGWFVDAAGHSAAMVLLHGSGGDRTSMLRRARFLHAAGYMTLMIDFRCHGESVAEQRTWGWRESRDATAAVAWVRNRFPGIKVGVLGTSLGGAAALLAKKELGSDAIVAESVFGDLRKAIWNRVDMRLGSLAADCLSPFLSMQVPLRVHVNLDDVSPVRASSSVPCPVFVIHGERDRHACIDEGRAIFDACPNPGKQWWEVKSAGHVDLCRDQGAEYEQRVLAFLDRVLRAG